MNSHTYDNDPMFLLMKRLKKIWDTRDFILGVCVHLKTEEAVKEMTDWLDRHKDEEIPRDEILLKALEIRYNEKYNDDGFVTRD